MVFFNYATMQMAAKIVYYGPGLCGKTTNLHHIYAKTSPQSRGEMVSLETETDRTLFFDLLPIDVGVIGGFKTRLQLYTIPGQVFYNTTRKLVLKGVDGIVFVADSQKAMLDANVESFKNLRENLAEIGLELDDIPLVVQLNKRDLPNIADVNTILDTLDPERKYEHSEAIAAKGDGVFETLKQISKLTLRTLRRRMTGEEPVKPASPAPPRRPIGEMSTFRVQDHSSGPRTIAGSTPIPQVASPSPSFTTPAAAATTATATATVDLTAIVPPPPQIEEIEEIPAADEIIAPPPTFDDVDSSIIADAPIEEPPPFAAAPVAEFVAEPEPLPPPPPPPPAPIPEPEIDFSQTEKPAKSPEVKHVKVRSSVDIMAELEGLRKRATQSTPKAPKKETVAADIVIETPKPKRDVVKSLQVPAAPGVMPQTRTLRVSVSFENEDGVVQKQEQFVELDDASDIQSVTLNIRIDS
ncbi:MAG: mutual gliding-motility protein MglA [Acidobacteriota bacterium]|jgi:signal recognition particle receptor subunit beta|nr:mutual gliding-motility protein MglA [Acidobacteriota bacterium]